MVKTRISQVGLGESIRLDNWPRGDMERKMIVTATLNKSQQIRVDQNGGMFGMASWVDGGRLLL